MWKQWLIVGVLVVNDTIVKGKYKYAEGTPVRTHKVRLVFQIL